MNVTQTPEELWKLHGVHQLELWVFHRDQEVDGFPICKYTKDEGAGRETEPEAGPRDKLDSSSVLTVGPDDSAWPGDIFLSIHFDPQQQRQAL